MTGRALRVDLSRPQSWLSQIGEPGLELASDQDLREPEKTTGAREMPAVDGRVVRVDSVEGAAVIEMTPFAMTTTGLTGDEDLLRLDIEGFGACDVAVRSAGRDSRSQRFEFRSVDPEVQRVVHRLARHLRTLDLITGLCDGEGSRGWIAEPAPAARLRSGGALWASVIAGRLVDGRAPRAEAGWEGDDLLLAQPFDGVDDGLVDVLCTSGSVTVATTATIAGRRLSFRDAGRLADRRRGRVTLISPIEATLGNRPAQLIDVSGQGFGVRVSDVEAGSPADVLELRVGDNQWTVSARHVLNDRVGLRTVPNALTWRGATVRSAEPLPAVDVTADAPRSTVVDLETEHGRVATRVTKVDGDGPPIGVVMTSGWGQTKESTGVLASALATALGSTRRPVEIVRFDYRNSRGGSWIDPKFLVPGREALGYRASGAVNDLTAVVDSLADRIGPDGVIVLIGISFSGPFALQVACDHPRVSGLVQMMAATDLQDLIRRSTGGIDVVAELDRGSPTGHLDILGVMLDTRTAIGDAVAIRLATFVHSEDLMHRCDVPVMWMLGASDRFVDPERVRRLCDATADATILELPGGHVPTSSAEVLGCVWPMARAIAGWAGGSLDRLAVPDEEVALALWQDELDEAPRLPMPRPEDYWRNYLLGDAGLMGYEILALTDQYRQLMADQVRLADLSPGDRIVDLGSGLGNVLDHLPSLEPPLDLLLCDLASEALGAGVARRRRSDVTTRLAQWDGESDPLPSEVHGTDVVLASLFLSVLQDPARLLGDLATRMRPGARLVVSSIVPDADLSVIVEEVLGDPGRAIANLPTSITVAELVEAVRAYVNSAADLMRRAELGEIRLYTQRELEHLVAGAGFTIVDSVETMGSPPRAVVVVGHVGEARD